MELTKNKKLRRLQWVGHVMRMKDERVPTKALKGYKEMTSWKARVRWRDAVDRHAERMSKCKNW